MPAKLLAEEATYTHYVEQKIEEKANKLPIFDSKYHPSLIAHLVVFSSTSIWNYNYSFLIVEVHMQKQKLQGCKVNNSSVSTFFQI